METEREREECHSDSAVKMATSNRPAHRPVRVSMAQMLFDRNNNSSTDTRHHLQSRPVAVPITPVFSSRYSWQPGLLPIRAASPRQQPIPTGFVPGRLIYSWPFNPQETDLIRAGYKPEYKLSKADRNKSKMAEPRARVARHKGQMNFPSERKYYYRYRMMALTDTQPYKQSASYSSPTEIQVPIHLSPPNPSPKQSACLTRSSPTSFSRCVTAQHSTQPTRDGRRSKSMISDLRCVAMPISSVVFRNCYAWSAS